MNPRATVRRIFNRVRSYNIFPHELGEDDNDDNEPRDPETILKHQRLATRLYVFLFIISFYVLILTTLMSPQSRKITVSNIDSVRFNDLRLNYGKTLSCPCSTGSVPYRAFVSHDISFDPVCSSVFISQQWIEALYLENASRYISMDFRMTASSLFELLAVLCSVSNSTVSQSLIDLDNNQLITIELLPENEIQSVVNETVELVNNNIQIQTISTLKFLNVTTKSNNLVSALSTDMLVVAHRSGDTFKPDLAEKWLLHSFNYTSNCIIPTGKAIPVGFYSVSDNPSLELSDSLKYVGSLEMYGSGNVSGFFGGLKPIDALLISTLDCLYDVTCFELLLKHFPATDQMNLTNSVLPSSQKNVCVYDRLSKLFVEKWSTSINYSKYIAYCAPSFCTYTTVDRVNVSYTITLLISLYGGLTLILRYMVTFLVNISTKIKRHSTNVHINFAHCVTYIRKCIGWAKQLNLFKSPDDRTANTIRNQIIITRTYLILLAGSILALLLFNSLNTQTATMTVTNSTFTAYKHLEALYSNTFQCPCSKTAIPFHNFISLSPTFHQVCSSDFVTYKWISMFSHSTLSFLPTDWRYKSSQRFQLLSTFCELAKTTVDDAVRRFSVRSFVTSNLLTEDHFNAQLNTTLAQFVQSTSIDYSRLLDIIRLVAQVDQHYAGIPSPFPNFNAQMSIKTMINETSGKKSWQPIFHLTGVPDIKLTYLDKFRMASLANIHCICATDPDCQLPWNIFVRHRTINQGEDYYVAADIVPGSAAGCFSVDSLLQDTLECLYSDLDCLSMIINDTYKYAFTLVGMTSKLDLTARPLIYNQMSTRFPRNTTLSTIVKELMIEQWNPSPSYDLYRQACAPTYCTYSQTEYVNNFVEIVVTMVGIIGGLIAALRIVTPQIVKIFISFFKPTVRRQNQVRLKLFDRLKAAVRKLITLLYTSLINLNVFPLWAFGSTTNQIRAKRLGQWATRLYIVLLTISFTIIILYIGIRPQTLTKNFNEPSFNVYNHLVRDHGDTLRCSCSSISSTYNQSVQIEPVFHKVCSSTFVSKQWHKNLVAGLVRDLSIYDNRDYRRFLSAHLQFLTGLCQLSIESINNSIHQFLTSSLVTNKILQKTAFESYIDSHIEQSKSSASAIFNRLLFLVQAMNHGNAIVSAYGTNFEYLATGFENLRQGNLWIKPVIYDNECSCGLNATCAMQATFIKNNPSEIISIKGFKMGCSPSESFLESTLECFYDSLCINLIQEQTNYKNTTITPVLRLPTTSRFLISTTVKNLIKDLFVEDWSTMINYSAYFEQCSPSICSYTYIQRLNSIDTVTFLFGIWGGLTLVLKWICPILLRLVLNVYERIRKWSNRVQPTQTINMATIEPTNVENAANNLEFVSTTLPSTIRCPSPMRRTRKIIFWFILFMILSVILVAPFFNLILKEKGQTESAVNSTNTTDTANENMNATLNTSTTASTITTTTTTTTPTSSTVSSCQLMFQVDNTVKYVSRWSLYSVAVGDFNGDSHLDFVVANQKYNNVEIVLGNGRGSFGAPTMFKLGDASDPIFVATDDFNNDSHLDIVISSSKSFKIDVLLGNGNGNFTIPITYPTGNGSIPWYITTGDLNGDDHVDIVVANTGMCNIGVLFGYGNGTFAAQVALWPSNYSCHIAVVLADFNGDKQLDIAFTKDMEAQVSILIGYGNGIFRAPITYSTGSYSFPSFIIADDFNNDGYLDIAISNIGNDNVGVLLGKGNGSFQEQMTFSMEFNSTPYPIITGDFNDDGKLDIFFGYYHTQDVGLLLGYGNGTFRTQMKIFAGSINRLCSLAVGDFNSDRRLDLVFTARAFHGLIILLNTCECCASKFHNGTTLT